MHKPGKIDIINMALAHVGVKSILGTDNTARAADAEKFYDTTLAALLSGYPWRFAGQRVLLSPLPAKPAFGWDNAFLRPHNMLTVRHIHRLEDDDWTVEGRHILANTDDPIKVMYTRDDIEEGEFHPLFVEMLALRLALMLASPIGKGSVSNARNDLNALYLDAEDRAFRADSFEYPPDRNRDESPYPEVLD